MCGIIGIVGTSEVSPRLMDGLRRLEYRGYDSAGLCTLVDGALERRRAEGKLDNLAGRLAEAPLPGTMSFTIVVPATVPSLFHNSSPLPLEPRIEPQK